MKLYIPKELAKQDFYKSMKDDLYEAGCFPDKELSDFTQSVIELKDIFQEVFPKLVSDNVRMDELNSYVVINDEVMNETVPEDWNHSSISNDKDGNAVTRTFKEYLYKIGESVDGKGLYVVRHKDTLIGTSESNLITSEELYRFIEKFGVDNIYTHSTSIATIKDVYKSTDII